MSDYSLWDEVVDISGISAIAGSLDGTTTTLSEMRSDGPDVLKAFADDVDLMQIEVVSTNIGFVRKYTKRFQKVEGGER